MIYHTELGLNNILLRARMGEWLADRFAFLDQWLIEDTFYRYIGANFVHKVACNTSFKVMGNLAVCSAFEIKSRAKLSDFQMRALENLLHRVDVTFEEDVSDWVNYRAQVHPGFQMLTLRQLGFDPRLSHRDCLARGLEYHAILRHAGNDEAGPPRLVEWPSGDIDSGGPFASLEGHMFEFISPDGRSSAAA